MRRRSRSSIESASSTATREGGRGAQGAPQESPCAGGRRAAALARPALASAARMPWAGGTGGRIEAPVPCMARARRRSGQERSIRSSAGRAEPAPRLGGGGVAGESAAPRAAWHNRRVQGVDDMKSQGSRRRLVPLAGAPAHKRPLPSAHPSGRRQNGPAGRRRRRRRRRRAHQPAIGSAGRPSPPPLPHIRAAGAGCTVKRTAS